METILTGILLFLGIVSMGGSVVGIASSDAHTPLYQATGTLHVDGSPIGMEVTLDGRVAGQVPESGVLIIDNIPVGEHRVIGSYPGYDQKEVVIDVPDGLPAEIRLDLTQERTGNLEISSTPPHVQIYVDDVYKGITPANIEIEVGLHKVLLRLFGYEDWSTQAEVRGGEATKISGTLVQTDRSPVLTPSGGPSFLLTILFVALSFLGVYCKISQR